SVKAAATPYVSSADVDGIVLRHRGGLGGVRAVDEDEPPMERFVGGLGQLSKNLIGAEFCARMVDGEIGVPLARRLFLGETPLDATRLDERTAEARTCNLVQHILQVKCTAEDRAEGVKLIRSFEAKT